MAKIDNVLLLIHIELEIEKILRKNQTRLRRNRSTTSQIQIIRRILRIGAKNLDATHLFVDFSKASDSIYWGKMKRIVLAYSLPRYNVAAIMIFYENTKVKVSSSDGDTYFFDVCRRCAARGLISIIPINNLPRLRTSDVDRFNERKWLYTGKRQEADDTPYELLQTRMT